MNQHTLTVTKTGSGNGTVASDPPGIGCGSTCSAQFDENTQITLTATPGTGSNFIGWAGDCAACGANSTCTITMDSDKTCTAKFVTSIPGDCNNDGQVSIDEVQKAINCFLSIQNTCCDKSDLNGDGQVTIDEVQKVINAFLGR